MTNLKILALSGSLRTASLNTALLQVAAQVAPTGIQLNLDTDLGCLPLFNPDLEANYPPQVLHLRQQIIESDAVLIASPEYAHGISGVMKNALDWMVGTEAFVEKPVALLNASPRASHAQAALREVLATMSVRIVEAASVSIPVLGYHHNAAEMLADPAIVNALQGALEQLQRTLASR